ncbi:hypothetical protein MNBD_UNCLBAC01-2079 [hydrothermal vent metagenome]|uniref:Protein kinase domain-containing protein n=1 Tax=hydrothermal vent metagenome TaxID=652676 RepID=A0A3B1CZ45_9ZZZZ
MSLFKNKHNNLIFKPIISLLIGIFCLSSIGPLPTASAQSVLDLPAVGMMVMPSQSFTPAMIRGIKVFPDKPFQFDFILDVGDFKLEGDALRKESEKLIKYFMAALTVPEEDLWVNLSPYEQDRIIPKAFGQTEMGRDLLAQDYILKQLTASLMYPEDELGEEFWDKVYEKAFETYGTINLPVNTFNKVWIVPETATVYENGDTALIVESHLKVMLEGDFLALESNFNNKKFGMQNLEDAEAQDLSELSSSVVRDVIIPAIEKEVNEGEHFAKLRQIYHAFILASWFKTNLNESLLGKIYVDQNKTTGIDIEDKNVKEKIYTQYIKAFKQGVYNYIKDEYDPVSQTIMSKKYFAGGVNLGKETALSSSPIKIIKKFSSLNILRKKFMLQISIRLNSLTKQHNVSTSKVTFDEEKKIFNSIEHLASGTTAHVYSAQLQSDSNSNIAIKVAKKYGEILGMPFELLIQREASILKELSISNRILLKKHIPLIKHQGKDYFAMTLLQGKDLVEHYWLRDFTLNEQLEITIQILSILYELHQQGFVHVDAQPGNFILDEDLNLTLTDFTFAGYTKKQSLFNTQAFSSDYIAPELLNPNTKNKKLLPRQDVYSATKTIKKILGQTSEGRQFINLAKSIFDKASSKHPEERYQNILPFAQDLIKILPQIQNSAYLTKYPNAFDGKLSSSSKTNIKVVSFDGTSSPLSKGQLINTTEPLGGIDLDRKKLNLKKKGEGIEFNANINFEYFENNPINGLTPIILNITPIQNLPSFLGINTEDKKPINSAQRQPFQNQKILSISFLKD